MTESDTGFNVGNEKYETDVAPTASPAPQETETADNNGEIAVAEKLKRLKAQAEEQMEETATYLSDAYTADELYKAMLAKGRRATVRNWCGNLSKTDVNVESKKKYYVHCALSLMRHSPKVAA